MVGRLHEINLRLQISEQPPPGTYGKRRESTLPEINSDFSFFSLPSGIDRGPFDGLPDRSSLSEDGIFLFQKGPCLRKSEAFFCRLKPWKVVPVAGETNPRAGR